MYVGEGEREKRGEEKVEKVWKTVEMVNPWGGEEDKDVLLKKE
jgi:hypothetical protein